MHLYHVNPEPVHHVVDGRLYTIPPGEAFEIEDPLHGRNILEHKAYLGIVEVPVVKTGRGIEFDVEGAARAAAAQLVEQDLQSVANWARQQVEDRVQKGLPVLPPPERIAGIIERRKIDLTRLGIEKIAGVVEGSASRDSRGELASLRAEHEALLEKFEELRQSISKSGKKSK